MNAASTRRDEGDEIVLYLISRDIWDTDRRPLSVRALERREQDPPTRGASKINRVPKDPNRCRQCWVEREPESFIGARGGRVRWCAVCRTRYKGGVGELPALPSRVRRDVPLRATLVVKSHNKKLGGIPSSMTSRNTCPSSCSFFGAGCYAEAHLVGFHWNNVAKRGDTWASFCASVRALPVGQLWRHNTAGDLPGDDETVDERLLGMLVDANRGRCGFTFTHCKTPPALAAIRRANDAGFTINLSADSLAQADLLARTGAGPVVVVIPSTSPDRGLRTPEGRHVVVCPAQRDKLTCATCRLCALPQRKSIIGFRAHGVSKARVDALVTLQRKPRPVGGMLLPPPPTESARRSPSSRSGPTFGLQSRLAPMPLCPEPKGPRGYACGRPAIAGGYCVWHALLRSRQVAPPPPDAAPPPSSAPATTPASAPRPTLLDETFAQAVRRRLEARGIHLRESIESPGGILTIVAERLGRRQVLAVRPIGAHYALSLAGSTLAIGDVVQRLAEPWTQRRSKGRTRAA